MQKLYLFIEEFLSSSMKLKITGSGVIFQDLPNSKMTGLFLFFSGVFATGRALTSLFIISYYHPSPPKTGQQWPVSCGDKNLNSHLVIKSHKEEGIKTKVALNLCSSIGDIFFSTYKHFFWRTLSPPFHINSTLSRLFSEVDPVFPWWASDLVWVLHPLGHSNCSGIGVWSKSHSSSSLRLFHETFWCY